MEYKALLPWNERDCKKINNNNIKAFPIIVGFEMLKKKS